MNKKLKFHISSEIILGIAVTLLLISIKPIFAEIISESGSADFHLYPAKCLYNGINHYTSYLNRDGKCIFFMTQWGEYAQGFYVMLFPFTFLDWNSAKIIWFLLNLSFIFLITYFLCKKFQISKLYFYLLLVLIYSSLVTKATLAMGQQAIFILFFLCLPFVFKSKLANILSGVSYFKYSIGYVLFIFYLISKKYKRLTLSLMPCVIGWLIYCYITNSNLFYNLFQPIELTIKNASTINQFYLFSFFNFFFSPDTQNYFLLMFIPTLMINFFIIKKIVKLDDELKKLSCLCLLILISMPHYPHDYIIIFPLLIYGIKCVNKDKVLFRINFFGALYFLNFYRAVEIYIEKMLVFFKIYAEFVEAIVYAVQYLNILILFFILIFNLGYFKKTYY